MSALIDREQVLHVARLARLGLSDDEVPVVTAKLAEILGYIEQLREVDTDGIEATAQIGVLRMPLREDVPQPGVPRGEVLASAPETAGGGFVVPSFVDT